MCHWPRSALRMGVLFCSMGPRGWCRWCLPHSPTHHAAAKPVVISAGQRKASDTLFSAMPDAEHDNRLCMHAVAQDIRPSAKGHRDFAPLSLIIHPTPQVWKLQEPLRTKLNGADSAFCGPGVPCAQEIVQTLDIGLCFREPDEPHGASACWAACAAS